MATATFIFAGPSVPRPLLSRYAQGAVLLPPVAAGDLLVLDVRPGDVVAIIDGYFSQRPAVRHKEILSLLDAGVVVHGAASMGALRAAELSDFGMIGHGRIYRDYRSGVIAADDEVALLHGTEEENYEVFTEALVNIRYALGEAVHVDALSMASATKVIEAFGQMPFVDRTLQALLARMQSLGLTDVDMQVVEKAIRQAPDAKQIDALALLDALRVAAAPVTPRHAWQIQKNIYLRTWQKQTQGMSEASLGLIPDAQVHELCRVVAQDYPAFRERVGIRALAAEHAAKLQLLPRKRDGQSVSRSRPGEDRDEATERRHNAEEALIQALRMHLNLENVPQEVFLHTAVIQRLRALGLLGPEQNSNSGLDRWCTRAEKKLPEPVRTGKAAARALFTDTALAWDDPFLDALRSCGAYARARARLIASLKFHNQIRKHRPTLRLSQLRPDNILAWFQHRWAVDNLEEAILERGFSNAEHFLAMARHYYLYEKAHAADPLFVIDRRGF